ncbi:MAG: flavin reductase family protein [Candidatus Methanomethyliaceae archaeon]|nr:flavin reductase family protein [Candidatus Methanomethyliaceae archaeon]MDW7970965.1 flavin reductase family protein [Nitrososphaerota archaeon]
MERVPENLYHRLLAPRVAAIIVALKEDNLPNPMIAAWHMPVSINPPILAISIAPTRYTHKLIQESGEFTINIPSPSLLNRVIKAGTISGKLYDKSGLFKFIKSTKLRTPIIDECMGAIECTLIRSTEIGDHSLILGQVVAVNAKDFDGVWKTSPLLHIGGDKYSIFQPI